MAAFLDVCRYIPTAGGTTDWTFAAAVTGYQSPASAGVVNGATYRYRAESGDLTQWEVGFGTYNTGTGVLTRTTVLFNNLGTTAKVSFSTVPQVAIVTLAEDLTAIADVAWTAYTPTITAQTGTPTTVSATGRYKQIGKTLLVSLNITVTTIGTAANSMSATLPAGFTSAATSAGAGKDVALNGKVIGGWVNTATTSIIDIRNYDNTTVWVNGVNLIFGIAVEIS